MACPGSVQLSRGIPNTSSAFAEEGTAAHTLAELSLQRGLDPSTFVGTTLEGVEVTEEMADYVRVYTDECRGHMVPHTLTHIEQRFNLSKLNPPGPMFGTADFVWERPSERAMGIVDLKYGKGVVVEVKGNKQLRYYALGAMLMMPAGVFDTITVTIVQPRAQHPDGVVRSETITVEELTEFAAELLAAAKLTQEPNPPLHAGSHCRFCPAAAICPEKLAEAQRIAQTEFSVMPLDVPPAPALLDNATIAEFLPKLNILEDWIKAVRAHAARELESGREVPGYKLVQKRATRYWKSDDETEQFLRAEGYDTPEIFKLELKSPAQIEKLVGKKNLPSDLVEKRSSGVTMAPAHDVRPAVVINPGEEFAAITSGDEE